MTRGRLIADFVGGLLLIGGVVLGLTAGGAWFYVLAGLGVGVAGVTEIVRVMALPPPRDPGGSV